MDLQVHDQEHAAAQPPIPAQIATVAESAPSPAVLSPRERQIASAVAEGMSNRDIASALGITEQTVKNHLTAIFTKMKVTSRLQLALAVLKHR
ncbi:MAG TPA: helix-turn-helix transcriptional regulator [Vicinamibacterales bacterium]|jgi:DNA-binding NarL/FixJ family response regulator|nr:helix-turn-helix transcriptional regulator [Vicinamibacterales bacterium]